MLSPKMTESTTPKPAE